MVSAAGGDSNDNFQSSLNLLKPGINEPAVGSETTDSCYNCLRGRVMALFKAAKFWRGGENKNAKKSSEQDWSSGPLARRVLPAFYQY